MEVLCPDCLCPATVSDSDRIADHPADSGWTCVGSGVSTASAIQRMLAADRPNIAMIVKRSSDRTPGRWQRGRFVQLSRFVRAARDSFSPSEKSRLEALERRIIRGPGVVGTAGCNPVMCLQDAQEPDIEFVAHAAGDVDDLLAYVSRLERALGKFGGLAALDAPAAPKSPTCWRCGKNTTNKCARGCGVHVCVGCTHCSPLRCPPRPAPSVTRCTYCGKTSAPPCTCGGRVED